jgi:hypothetical protein
MKSYTNIEQSKKLAEILPFESADMRYAPFGDSHPWIWDEDIKLLEVGAIPCWSFAALLEVLPSATVDISDDHHYRLYCNKRFSEWHNNLIDACYEMILKLHEQNIL